LLPATTDGLRAGSGCDFAAHQSDEGSACFSPAYSPYTWVPGAKSLIWKTCERVSTQFTGLRNSTVPPQSSQTLGLSRSTLIPEAFVSSVETAGSVPGSTVLWNQSMLSRICGENCPSCFLNGNITSQSVRRVRIIRTARFGGYVWVSTILPRVPASAPRKRHILGPIVLAFIREACWCSSCSYDEDEDEDEDDGDNYNKHV
jgi:hypothetical protein